MPPRQLRSFTPVPATFAIAAAILIAIPHARCQEPETDYRPALQKLQDAITYEVEQKQMPAFSIALVDGEHTVWAEGFGYQDAAQQVPATASIVYRESSTERATPPSPRSTT